MNHVNEVVVGCSQMNGVCQMKAEKISFIKTQCALLPSLRRIILIGFHMIWSISCLRPQVCIKIVSSIVVGNGVGTVNQENLVFIKCLIFLSDRLADFDSAMNSN